MRLSTKFNSKLICVILLELEFNETSVIHGAKKTYDGYLLYLSKFVIIMSFIINIVRLI